MNHVSTDLRIPSLPQTSNLTTGPREVAQLLDVSAQEWLDSISSSDVTELRKLDRRDLFFSSWGAYLEAGMHLDTSAKRKLFKLLYQVGVIHFEDPYYVVNQSRWCKLHGHPFPINRVLAYLMAYYAKSIGEAKVSKDFSRIVWIGANFTSRDGYMLGLIPETNTSFKWTFNSGRASFAELTDEDIGDMTNLKNKLGDVSLLRSDGKIEHLCPPKQP